MFYVYAIQSLKYPPRIRVSQSETQFRVALEPCSPKANSGSRADKIYIGYTTDLRKRFSLHQKGLVKSTKPYRPWKCIFYEAYLSKIDAKSRKKYFKTAKGKRVLKLMLQATLKIPTL